MLRSEFLQAYNLHDVQNVYNVYIHNYILHAVRFNPNAAARKLGCALKHRKFANIEVRV